MIYVVTTIVAILIPIILWTVVCNFLIFKNGWTWVLIRDDKTLGPMVKFMFIWGKFWLYTTAVAAWLAFSYMIAYVMLNN